MKITSKIKTLRDMTHILKTKENMGDAAVLKMTLFADEEGDSPYRQAALEQKELNFKPLNMAELSKLPSDSLGYNYYQFMVKNKLSPLNFSSRIREIFERYPVTVRYVRLHDMFHVLLGFDTSPAGEVGVYSFIGVQHYTKTLDWAAKTAHRVSHMMFWQINMMVTARQRGLRLADGATPLITLPMEDMLDQSLQDLREKYLPNYTS